MRQLAPQALHYKHCIAYFYIMLMKLTISIHAAGQMKARGITEEGVRNILASPILPTILSK